MRYAGCTCSVMELGSKDALVHTYGAEGKLERLSDIVKASGAIGGVNWDFFNMRASARQETIHWSYDKVFGLKNFFKGDNYIEVAMSKDGRLVVDDIDMKDAKSYEWVTMGGFTLIKNGKEWIEKTGLFSHWRYRHPRTALGQRPDGTLLLVTVDGRRWNERGMNGKTLAVFMKSMGCRVAVSGDGGGSTEMYFRDLKKYNRVASERYIGGAFIALGEMEIPYPGKMVHRGSRGYHVKEVQAKLGLVTDGIAGRNTERAIRDYQRENGLIIDGWVGPATWQRMFG